MKTVKTCELIGPALEFMVHMADVSMRDGKVVKITANFLCHFDMVEYIDHDGNSNKLISEGVPIPDSRRRAIVAAKLGDTVQIPDELWTAQNDTAPTSRPDSKDAGTPN